MKRFQGLQTSKAMKGLQTSKAMIAAGMLAAVLVTGCTGGGDARRQSDTEAGQEETAGAVTATDTADAGNASNAAAAQATLLAEFDSEIIAGTGERTTLTEIAGGRPLVVNMWATWCPYCVEEMPGFAEVAGEYGDRVSFAFLDIADGARETVDGTKAWLAEHGLDSLPVYYDTPDTGFGVTASLQASSLPTTVIVGSDGEVKDRIVGMVDTVGLRQMLDVLA